MDARALSAFVDAHWARSVLPRLCEYIRIPNRSPAFDPRWQEEGHMDRAVALAEAWCREQRLAGLELEVMRLPGRTPLLLAEVPAQGAGSGQTALLYGHLDKQPEMTGWREDLGPWEPVLEGDRLYGRGGADDGYAVFASLTALCALQAQGVAHPRCLVLIECCEESGSYDLPAYIDALAERIGTPRLVICLDSGCGNYEQLWLTSSLRGAIGGDLTVRVLREGVHSGDAGGIVPSSFRILRALLSRLEDERDGAIRPRFLHVPIPERELENARHAAGILGRSVYERFPLAPGVTPAADDPLELILNRTWRPALEITGAGGLPAVDAAGNVLRPVTSARISLRLPPGIDAAATVARLRELLCSDPPQGAAVRFEPGMVADGWHAPAPAAWLRRSLERTSREFFGREPAYMGEGGTIPFMAMLGERFPDAQFVITGVLGPQANAHGPNEFLHLPTARRLSACVAGVLADLAAEATN